MDIGVGPDLEEFIHRNVMSGRYASASAVVGEALRLMEEREQLHALSKTEMSEQIAAGLASLRAGKGMDGEAFFAQMEGEFEELERQTHR